MRRTVYALVLAAWLATPLGAVDGRDFAGRYDLTQVTQQGDGTVSLTVVADVQNVSGGDIAGVTFQIENDGRPPATAGPLDLPNGSSIRIGIPIAIDTATYEQWSSTGIAMAGGWTDGDGRTQRRQVELVRTPLTTGVQ